MLWFFLVLAVVAFVITLLVKRAFRQKNTTIGTIETPAYTENKLSPDFVFVTFRPEKEQPLTVEYYYDKHQYQTPQDFVRLNKTVTVKYDPGNSSNFTIYEEEQGSYMKYVGPAVLGGFIGSLAASTSEGTSYEKVKYFFIAFAITFLVTYVFFRLRGYLSFLNVFTKRDE